MRKFLDTLRQRSVQCRCWIPVFPIPELSTEPIVNVKKCRQRQCYTCKYGTSISVRTSYPLDESQGRKMFIRYGTLRVFCSSQLNDELGYHVSFVRAFSRLGLLFRCHLPEEEMTRRHHPVHLTLYILPEDGCLSRKGQEGATCCLLRVW